MVYLGAPCAAVAGVWLADHRALRLHRLNVDTALTAYDVELKARYSLHAALWGHPYAKHGRIGSGAAAGGADVEAGGNATAHASSHGAMLEEDDDTAEIVTAARRCLTPGQLAAAEAVFRRGAEEFRKSAIMHLFAARFHDVFASNKHLHMRCGKSRGVRVSRRIDHLTSAYLPSHSHLLRASRLHPPLDVDFEVYVARQAAESNPSGGGSLNALARVAFEKHLSDARKHSLLAMKAQSAFWGALEAPTPSLVALHGVSVKLRASIDAAERAFRELLTINRTSLVVVRLYALFSRYVVADSEKVRPRRVPSTPPSGPTISPLHHLLPTHLRSTGRSAGRGG